MEKYVYLQNINNGEIRLSTKYNPWRNTFIYKIETVEKYVYLQNRNNGEIHLSTK